MEKKPKVIFLEMCVKCAQCGFWIDEPQAICPRCGAMLGEVLEPIPGLSCEFCGGPVFEGFGCGKIECANKRRAEEIEAAQDMPENEIPF